jgi:hypothetical protein
MSHVSPSHYSNLSEQGASVILFGPRGFIYSSSKAVLLNENTLRMSRIGQGQLIFPWTFLLDISWFAAKIINKGY